MQQATINLLADMGFAARDAASRAWSQRPQPPTRPHPPPRSRRLRRRQSAAESSVTITGTATDSGGGVIGVVEVSVDGGATWHRAVGP